MQYSATLIQFLRVENLEMFLCITQIGELVKQLNNSESAFEVKRNF